MKPSLPAIAFALVAVAGAARAQELEPRAYSTSPVGTNFVAVVWTILDGDVLFDPTVPITNAHADIDVATFGYGRTFGLWGRQALLTVAVPYAVAHVEGDVGEEFRTARRSGLVDARVKGSIHLLGGKALSPSEFAGAPRKTVLATSLTVQVPIGEYEPSKLINLGTNRWAFKPELGAAFPVGHWSLEAYAGVWFFMNNDAFYPGASTKRQDPLASLQGHVSYTFRSRVWVAVDGTWYGGGETTIDDGPPSSRFDNSRYGGTLSVPVTKRQSLKLSASRGASARTGSNFDSYSLAWQMHWFGSPNPERSPR